MSKYKVVPVEPTVQMRMPWKTLRGHCWHDKYQSMLDASPDTGMAAVPRELLERLLANDGGDGRYSLTEWNAARKELRTILEKSND